MNDCSVRILLVHPEGDIRDMITEAVRELAPVDVSEGGDALELFRAHRHAVVITELKISKLSGHVLAENISRTRRTRESAPFIFMVTSHPGRRQEDHAKKCGVSIYLRKPFEMEILTDAVRGTLDALGVG